MKKIFSNLLNSINGLKVTLKEHSFVIEIIGGFILIPYLVIVEMEIFFKLIIITIYFLLLAFELINTAIEKLSDKITKDLDDDIKKIKDISSASVFVILFLLITSLILTHYVWSKVSNY